jgi:hypothetical protein
LDLAKNQTREFNVDETGFHLKYELPKTASYKGKGDSHAY